MCEAPGSNSSAIRTKERKGKEGEDDPPRPDHGSDSSLIVKQSNTPHPHPRSHAHSLSHTHPHMEKGRVGVGAVSALPATLYKFCIILAMNSSFCSKADRSKGGEGPGESWGRVKMHTESFKVLDREGRRCG